MPVWGGKKPTAQPVPAARQVNYLQPVERAKREGSDFLCMCRYWGWCVCGRGSPVMPVPAVRADHSTEPRWFCLLSTQQKAACQLFCTGRNKRVFLQGSLHRELWTHLCFTVRIVGAGTRKQRRERAVPGGTPVTEQQVELRDALWEQQPCALVYGRLLTQIH